MLDAGPLIELADARSPLRSGIEQLLRVEPGRVVLPAPVSAEVDYLIGQRMGRMGRRVFLKDLAEGRFHVACLDAADYQLVSRYDEDSADLDVGLADLSVAVLAYRFETRRIMTFDERHFRALRPIDGGSFVLLPMDG